MTFANLDVMVTRFARALAVLDLPSGGTAAVRFRNPVTHWLVLLGLARIGIASAGAADASAHLLITDEPGPASRQPVFHASSAWVSTVQASSAERYQPVRPGRDRLGHVLMSSGTTGMPKRVGLSWRLIDTAIRSAAVLYGPVRPGPWLISELNIDTTFGFTATLAAWAAGQPILLRGETKLEAALARFEPPVVALVPLQVQRALAQLPQRFKPYSGMRLFVPGGSLSPGIAREARLRLTSDIRTVYGAAECGIAAIGDASLLAEHRGVAGHAVPGAAIEIVDADGKPLPLGEQGEVRIQTDRLVGGYLDGDSPPGLAPIRNGWFYPGDLGRFIEDGLLLIQGRTDDIMNIGGVKLKGSNLDDALADCPGVVESFAFAAPNPEGQDECCIALVRTDGFDQDTVLTRLRSREAAPPSVRLLFLDRLPRTPTGKVARAALVAMAASTLPAIP